MVKVKRPLLLFLRAVSVPSVILIIFNLFGLFWTSFISFLIGMYIGGFLFQIFPKCKLCALTISAIIVAVYTGICFLTIKWICGRNYEFAVCFPHQMETQIFATASLSLIPILVFFVISILGYSKLRQERH